MGLYAEYKTTNQPTIFFISVIFIELTFSSSSFLPSALLAGAVEYTDCTSAEGQESLNWDNLLTLSSDLWPEYGILVSEQSVTQMPSGQVTCNIPLQPWLCLVWKSEAWADKSAGRVKSQMYLSNCSYG